MSVFGFSFKHPDDVYSKFNIVHLNFEKSNPLITYDEADKFKCLFVVNGFLPLQFIMFKKDTTNLKGNFVVIDNPRSLSENKVKCLDCVYKSGMSMRTQYEGDIDLLMKKGDTTKFPKKLKTLYVKDRLYKNVSTWLTRLKHIHKDKELTFDNVLQSFTNECKKHNVNLKKAHRLFAKAVTNNISYDSLSELGVFASKYATKLKRMCSKGDMSKNIITFQDIVYFLTDKDTAIAEDMGDTRIVSKLFELWNPKPTKRKEITFKFNKKPLPNNIYHSKKKFKQYEEQEHIIPSYICERRKKNKKSLFNPKVIGFNDLKIPTIKEGLYSKKEICNILGIDKFKIIGGYKDGKLIFRHGEIISVKNSENNKLYYLRVI